MVVVPVPPCWKPMEINWGFVVSLILSVIAIELVKLALAKLVGE